MPRAGDAFLQGQLPRTHDPLDRISSQPPLIEFNLDDLLEQAIRYVEDILFPAIEELTGIDLSAFLPVLESVVDLLETLFALNPLSGDFDPVTAVTTFVELMVALGTTLPVALFGAFFGLFGGAGNETEAGNFFTGILGLLGNPTGLLTGTGSLPGIASIPLLAGLLAGSTLLGSLIPGLDASKIITGVFGTGLIPGLDVSKIVTGVFGTGFIPGLDVAKIISGTFGSGFIPGLDASKIITGTFGTGLIPGLDISKITSGLLSGGTILTGLIPGLDAAKIISGTFGTGLIPGLDAAKIISGTFGTGLIPGLDISKITSGLLSGGTILTSLIPGLDTSKITSGTFPMTIVSGLLGLFGGATTSTQAGNFSTNLLSMFGAPALTGSTGSFDPQSVQLVSPTQHAQSILDPFVQFLGGLSGGFFSTSEFSTAAQAAATQINTTAGAVASMQAQINKSGTSGGLAYLHDFSGDANSTSVHSDFTRSYSGAGSRSFETNGGTLKWVGGSGTRTADVRLTSIVTETDYQLIGGLWTQSPGVFVSKPFWWSSPTYYYGYQWIKGRVNAAGTVYVIFYMFGDGDYEFGYVNGGAYTVLDSGNIAYIGNFPPDTYYLQCGTAGNLRSFRLLNSAAKTTAWTFTDGSAVTAAGSLYRGAGWGAYADNNVQSSPLRAVSLADYSVAPILGSAARFARASTTTVSHGSGVGFLANNFLDTTEFKTSDITWTPGSNNGATVSVRGNYLISAGIKNNSASTLMVGITVNAVVTRWGHRVVQTTGQASGAWYQPLEVGDVVRPVFSLNTTSNLSGDVNLAESFFELVRVGSL